MSTSFHQSEMAAVEPQRPLMTPELLKAAIEGNEKVLTELLRLEESRNDHVNVTIDAGAEFDSSAETEHHNHLQSATFMGNTVLHILCSNDHDALASKICNKDTSLLKAHNKMLETPLHCAAKAGCTRTVSTLLKFGAEAMVRERNCHGETALHEAARHHHEGIIKELMTVDPELAYEIDTYGISALEVSLARGNNEMVDKLSDQWINARICSSRPERSNYMENAGNAQKPINMSTSVDILRGPPIHLVASVGNTDGAKLLLQKDASLAYLQDSDGLFPIHIAARMGHVEMVILFMEKYLDSGELLDHRGRNFLHIAAEENKINIFTKLFALSDDNGLPLLWKGMLTGMINSVDNKGNTPLHLAVENGCKSVEKTLMENKKLDANIRNRRGSISSDIPVIQVKENTENSRLMQDLQDKIEQYVQKEGAKITSDEKKDSDDYMAKLQIIGLGSVLVTTVTFAAAFTLPGGNTDSGLPVLGKKYVFKAFILADTLAFIQSFFCTVLLMFGGLASLKDPEAKKMLFAITMYFFSNGARSMVLAFGLGLYLVMSPISRGFAILILFLVISSVLADLSSRVFIMILKSDEDDEDDDEIASTIFFQISSVVGPFFTIFLFALIH